MDIGSSSPLDLVRRCKRGESRAWREFALRYTKFVYGLSLRMLRNQAEAEDASQETFLRVHKYFDRFDTTRPVEPWISSIAYNVCLRRLKGVARTSTKEADTEGLTSPEEAQGFDRMEDGAASREEASLLQVGLASLAAQDRAILHMHYWQGMSTAEVSEAVDMPANTVKIRLFRARGKLRKVLGPLMGEDVAWT
jgi:RNA polymerase sigma-70 factor, ECF subfamily